VSQLAEASAIFVSGDLTTPSYAHACQCKLYTYLQLQRLYSLISFVRLLSGTQRLPFRYVR
jgi:hypothetical protein